MAFPTLSVPPYPDIPAVAGVPNVARNPNAAIAAALAGGIGGINQALSIAITANGQLAASNPAALPPAQVGNWGVYDSTGNPVVIPDTILDVEFRGERRLSDYPQEQGAFASYNKVDVPYSARVRMAKGGALYDRQVFLQTIDALLHDTNLYTLITPEINYQNANVVHYDYHRTTRNGATLVIVDLWVEEVRLTGTQTLSGFSFLAASQVAAPSGASPQFTGPVQPVTPSNAQTTQIGTPAAPGNTGNWIPQSGAFPSQ